MRAALVLVALALIALAFAQLSSLIKVGNAQYVVCGLFKGGPLCESAHRIFWAEVAAILLLTQAAWIVITSRSKRG